MQTTHATAINENEEDSFKNTRKWLYEFNIIQSGVNVCK